MMATSDSFIVTVERQKMAAVLKFAILWLLLTLAFLAVGYIAYCFILMSRGDINHDGIIDGTDTAIMSRHTLIGTDPVTETFTEVAAPTASTATPKKTIHKPIIYLQ